MQEAFISSPFGFRLATKNQNVDKGSFRAQDQTYKNPSEIPNRVGDAAGETAAPKVRFYARVV